jgi:hypothetical protein
MRENGRDKKESKLVPISSSMLPPPLMLLFCGLDEKTLLVVLLFLSEAARRSAFCAVARNMMCVFLGENFLFECEVFSRFSKNSKDRQILSF